MTISLRQAALVSLLAGLVAGCANSGNKNTTKEGSAASSSRAKAPELSQERQILSEGYSMLYRDAGNLDLSKLILYVKGESESVKKVVTDVSEFGEELKKELERIDRDYPGVRTDLDPLPEMEKRKRSAISKTRALYFAPVVGKGGREYERTVLIGYVNGLNHERHLCKVMAEAEPDAGLKKFLLDTEKRYDALHDRITALLEKEYFRDPNGKIKD